MRKNVSGQFVYFSMISALSGTPLTGLSGMISGTKSLDGLSGMIVLSGNVIELGNGSYRANLYDYDTNGNQIGFLFTAPSGAVPVQYQFDTVDGNGSGALYLASGSITSGLFVTVPIATLSGVVANSGIYATVPPATLSGVVTNSGLFVTATATVNPASISGAFVTVPTATISGVVANSGLYVTVPPATLSGVVANSGIYANVPPATISGVNAVPASGTAYLNSGWPSQALSYDYSGFADVSGRRCLINATRKLMNRFDLNAFSGRLAVYREDDLTIVFLQDVTALSGAQPITQLKGP
jgi:hypothetical protein